jgi:hypothetical protein
MGDRGLELVGCGYTGRHNWPFAPQNSDDFPAVLAGWREFGLEVPMINRTVVDYLLGRGFRIDSFMALSMSNIPFGRFEHYIVTSPPFFI